MKSSNPFEVPDWLQECMNETRKKFEDIPFDPGFLRRLKKTSEDLAKLRIELPPIDQTASDDLQKRVLDVIQKNKNKAFRLPTNDSQFKRGMGWDLGIDEIKPIDDCDTEFDIQFHFESTNIKSKNIFYGEIKRLKMKVKTLEQEIEEKNLLITSLTQKHVLLLSPPLTKFYEGGGSPFIFVKEIQYIKNESALHINAYRISIKNNSNQSDLCKVIFATKESIGKRWEIMDIVDAYGEDSSYLKRWIAQLRDTVRHLNDKIQKKTGLEKFIIFEKPLIYVNPKYLES